LGPGGEVGHGGDSIGVQQIFQELRWLAAMSESKGESNREE
jgi:hypothetical protein